MHILLSPAKTFTKFAAKAPIQATVPGSLNLSEELMKELRGLSASQLKDLTGLSDSAIEKIVTVIGRWSRNGGWPAALSYSGDTFHGFGLGGMNEDEIAFAQNHVRIVSGLYGLLRPLDRIHPYRLELKSRLKGEWGNSIYDFWGDSLAGSVRGKDRELLMLASDEISRAILPYLEEVRTVTPRFIKIDAQGKAKPSFPKYSRGLVARWVCKNRVTKLDNVINFDLEGYRFCEQRSTEEQPVFIAEHDFTTKGRFKKSA